MITVFLPPRLWQLIWKRNGPLILGATAQFYDGSLTRGYRIVGPNWFWRLANRFR